MILRPDFRRQFLLALVPLAVGICGQSGLAQTKPPAKAKQAAARSLASEDRALGKKVPANQKKEEAAARAKLSHDKLELKKKLGEIDNKLRATKRQITLIKNADFLIGLYFNLADLQAEKSRLLYILKIAENPNVPDSELQFTKERRPKEEAIETYQKIYSFFPKSEQRDRALFYKAHEQRDLGDFQSMVLTLSQLVKEFPQSTYWSETQILLGDYLMEEKKDVDGALERYQAVITRPLNLFTSVAHYRSGWCQVNKLSYPEAFKAFEKAIETDMTKGQADLPEVYRKTDVRKEAVLSLVTPFVELYSEKNPLVKTRLEEITPYFFNASDTFDTYEKALVRLNRRFLLKSLFAEAARASSELLNVSNDLGIRTEAAVDFYRSFKKVPVRIDYQKFLTSLGTVVGAVRLETKLSERERQTTMRNLEIVFRDVALTLDKWARRSKTQEDYLQAADAYATYAWTYNNGSKLPDLKVNQAEDLFNANHHIDAGVAYEQLQKHSVKRRLPKQLDESAIEAYIQALKDPDKLSPAEQLQARFGLRGQGESWLKKNPRHKAAAGIRFNVALSWYEEKEFEPAIKWFQTFISSHPQDARVRDSVFMIINSYSQLDDNVGLTKAAPGLLKVQALSAAERSQIQEVVRLAQRKELRLVAGEFGTTDYIKKLRNIASAQKGTALGDQALAEAFEALESKRDRAAYGVGEELLARYSDSSYTKKVVASMAKMAVTTADFGKAAVFFEAYSKKYPKEPESNGWLKSAADIREWMGDFELAKQDFIRLGRFDKAAEMDRFSGNWPALEKSAARLSNLTGRYWVALAQYRQGRIAAALPSLKAVATSPGRSPQERDAVAHASYLLSSQSLQAFKAIQMKDASDQKALATKISSYKSLQGELEKVLKLGSGKWTIAALYGLGQASHEISDFMVKAPIPAGLNADQQRQYTQAIGQQALPFQKKSQQYFADCLATAQKFEVFTRFVNGCLARGSEQVDEAQDTQIRAKGAESEPQQANALRAKLFDSPRNKKTLQNLAEAYIGAEDYAMAAAILNRVLEIDATDANARATLGVTYLFMNDLDRGFEELKKALTNDSDNSVALWHIAALYHEFQFKAKYQTALARAGKKPRPGVQHPFLKRI